MKTKVFCEYSQPLILPAILTVLLSFIPSCGGGGGGGAPLVLSSVTATASLSPGVYNTPQSVTLTASIPATIYYSLDGNKPSVGGSNTLSGPSPVSNIQITGDTNLLQYFAVAGSGGKGPIESETYIVTNGTATGPGDIQNYYPLTLDNTWISKVTVKKTGAPPTTYTDASSVTGTAISSGVTAMVLTESNPDNTGVAYVENLVKSSNGLVLMGSNDPIDNQVEPYHVAKFPFQIGSSFVSVNKKSLDYGADLDSDGKNELLDLTSIVTAQGLETVTVSAGTFTNCLRQEQDATLTLTLSRNAQKITVKVVDTTWLAPGMGPVKQSTVATGNGRRSETTEEMTAYYIDGQGKGVMPQFVVAGGVANANSDTETPGKSAIGFDGTNYLVVFSRNTGSTGIYGVIVSGQGYGRQIKSFPISQQSGQFARPAVAFDGTNYLVVFQNGGQIFGARVSPSGDVPDGPNGFVISTTGTSNWEPVIAFDGANYLVVWEKFLGEYDIYGARVTPSGQALGEFPIFQAPGEQIEPSIAIDGNNYMVVWRDTRSGSGPSSDTDIYGTRVTPTGTVLDAAGIPISTAPNYQGEPSITFDGTNYFVVWGDLGTNRILGRRIKSDGTLLDGSAATGGIAITDSSMIAGYQSVVFDGANYLVVWSDPDFSNDPKAGVYVTRVSPNGSLVDAGNAISISGPPPAYSRYVYPQVLANGKGFLTVWVNNIELSGTTKDINGVLIYPY
jgi:hypothetical protein